MIVGRRTYTIGAALIAGAATYHWWPPDLQKQAGELIVVAIGAALITLRAGIQTAVVRAIREMLGEQPRPPEKKTGPDP